MPDAYVNDLDGVPIQRLLSNPGRSFRLLTPNDSLSFPATRAIYVGGAGDITVVGVDDGSPVLFSSVPGGTMLPFQIVKLMATGTTATSVVAIR